MTRKNRMQSVREKYQCKIREMGNKIIENIDSGEIDLADINIGDIKDHIDPVLLPYKKESTLKALVNYIKSNRSQNMEDKKSLDYPKEWDDPMSSESVDDDESAFFNAQKKIESSKAEIKANKNVIICKIDDAKSEAVENHDRIALFLLRCGIPETKFTIENHKLLLDYAYIVQNDTRIYGSMPMGLFKYVCKYGTLSPKQMAIVNKIVNKLKK